MIKKVDVTTVIDVTRAIDATKSTCTILTPATLVATTRLKTTTRVRMLMATMPRSRRQAATMTMPQSRWRAATPTMIILPWRLGRRQRVQKIKARQRHCQNGGGCVAQAQISCGDGAAQEKKVIQKSLSPTLMTMTATTFSRRATRR